jgi:hypothetical protein
MKKRLIPTLLVFVVTVCALLPSALSLPQHGDEKMYIWKAGYYGSRLAHLDFTPGTDGYRDPGWSPYSFWAFEQPLGSHLIYAAALGITHSQPPALPYSWVDPILQGPDTAIPDATLIDMRLAAILCAALGAAMLALRFGWSGVVAFALLLAIPNVRNDLARAWAEGPLLLGFGLCAVTWCTRWLAPVCGIAAAFKLTAIALWPLMFWHGFGQRRFSKVSAVVIAFFTWSLFSPTSWRAGGPPYLIVTLVNRGSTYVGQSIDYGGPFGFFLPTRYLWPIELAALLVVCCYLLPRLWHRFRPIDRPSRSGASS